MPPTSLPPMPSKAPRVTRTRRTRSLDGRPTCRQRAAGATTTTVGAVGSRGVERRHREASADGTGVGGRDRRGQRRLPLAAPRGPRRREPLAQGFDDLVSILFQVDGLLVHLL